MFKKTVNFVFYAVKKKEKRIDGVVTAMVTPFEENGMIDFKGLEKLSLYLIENGSDAVVVNGTTGENMTTTEKEKVEVVLTVRSILGSKVPIIVNIHGNSTREVIQRIKVYEELDVDAVMVVTPYYIKPTREGIIEHYRAIAESSSLRIFIYDNPNRTSSSVDSEMLVELSNEKNLVAVKDSSDGLALIQETLSTTDHFDFFCGVDSLTVPFLACGAVGSISVLSHLIGVHLNKLHSDFESMPTYRKKESNALIQKISSLLSSIPGTVAVKMILKELGIIQHSAVRLPLSSRNIDKEKYVRQFLDIIDRYK